ncbi:hypothetical protein LMG7974_01317 [Campylobacter majalis]|uniref:Pyridoxamine 5'-phosphate oxidase putative domain-containing protein n=1 Tax=Campylobacter majalis TaxID=2790656 RepID=A0ABN7KB93_9BACT|nr:hypothetical protein [Campylobacter majalis]CAD7289061.1 hypothetical protein LMG7974_01317 [Campylobacter majalis]
MHEKISKFLHSQHLASICVLHKNLPYSFSAFYAYDDDTKSIIFASDTNTTHTKAFLSTPKVSATIALNTLKVAKIQGVQILGIVNSANEIQKECYYRAFAFSKTLNPTLWACKIKWIKYTDNTLGFGKKIIWENEKL